jgi:hypothetical protein
MIELCKAGRASVLLDLVERAPSADAVAGVWEFLSNEGLLKSLLGQPRLDMPLITRLAKRIGPDAVPTLLSATLVIDDAKVRSHFYDLLQSLGDQIGDPVAARIADAPPLIQRELLSLLGKLTALPAGFSPRTFLSSPDPLVRREAVRLLLRSPSERDETIMSALSDTDDRVVFAGLTVAQERCPAAGIRLIRQRVDKGELDSQLRTMGIRIAAQQHNAETLAWFLSFVVFEAHWPRRPKLKPSTPEMLAALSVIAANWRTDPAAETALELAEHSKDAEVRAKISRAHGSTPI